MQNTFNYQIMTETNADGKYTPDYDTLIASASCDAEAEQWRWAKSMDATFAWNMVVAIQYKCGDWEILQSPVNEYHPLEKTFKAMVEHASTHNCSRCISRMFNGF